jgi:5-methylcytosine-specific restriction endonuclease McrA
MTVSMRSAHSYGAYLNGPKWKERRTEALQRAGYRCQRCKADEALEVHHLTYDRLGFERPQDLMVLCNPCHADEHGRPAKSDRVVSLKEAFERSEVYWTKREHLEDEQELVLQAAMEAAGVS